MAIPQTNRDLPHQSDLVKSIYEQQQLGLNVDLLLSSGDKRISVHLSVMRISCPMLNDLLNFNCSCSQPKSLILPECYSAILSSFASLLYTGYSAISEGMVGQVKELSALLGLSNISICQRKKETPENSVIQQSIGEDMVEDGSPVLKLTTNMEETNQSFKLSFPKSRNARNISNLGHIKVLDGFHKRLQEEYNMCPVGKYAGPYDQSEKLKLKIQLRIF